MFLVHLKHVGLKSDSNGNSNSNTINRATTTATATATAIATPTATATTATITTQPKLSSQFGSDRELHFAVWRATCHYDVSVNSSVYHSASLFGREPHQVWPTGCALFMNCNQ